MTWIARHKAKLEKERNRRHEVARCESLIDSNPIDGDNLRQRVFYPLLKRAGLRHCRLHDLRHTYASLLIQNGESLKYIQEQMGHSSIQVTADIYGHLIPGANKAAVDRLDGPIRNPGATESDDADDPIAVSD